MPQAGGSNRRMLWTVINQPQPLLLSSENWLERVDLPLRVRCCEVRMKFGARVQGHQVPDVRAGRFELIKARVLPLEPSPPDYQEATG
jgi:hypothetical protein